MNTPVFASSRRKQKRAYAVMLIIGMLVFITFVISMNTGHIRLTVMEVFKTLFGMGTDRQWLILYEFRLPRIVISVLVGAALAVSGAILQGISRNALADPGILGINAGAGLMVMLFVFLNPVTTAAPVYMLPVLALFGSGFAAFLIYILSYKKHEGISPTRLVLSGIGVSAGISSAMIVLTLKLDPDKYHFVATWLAGSIWGTNWKFVSALLPWVIILLPFVFYKARVLNVLNLGEQTSVGLGASVKKEQLWLLAAAVGLAGSAVSVSGGIGFVGLIAPHLARRLVGPRHELLLPTAALTGSLLLIAADTIGRSIFQPMEIPVGIVVAVIGAPYFLYLLARTKG